MNSFSPFICGISGLNISPKEEEFIRLYKPWGVILFARNCIQRHQLIDLTKKLKDISHNHIPIIIDQEGGRVGRLKFIKNLYPASIFGDIYIKSKNLGREALGLQCKIIANELKSLGINTNTVPVLDIPQFNESGVIGNRAFSRDINIASDLGKIVIETYKSMGILTIIKHIPGHGRAEVDSHHKLPVVNSDLNELKENDFYPFLKGNHSHLAMTTHIVYSQIDNKNPATLSKKVIDKIIRGHIDFKGLLMTDDLSMKALKGDLGDLAKQSIDAGCNLVLHCNGNLDEMVKIAESLKNNVDNITLKNELKNVMDTKVNIDINEASSKLKTIIDDNI